MNYDPTYADRARDLCVRGATIQELADHFEVCVRTIYRWQVTHDEFGAAVKVGKDAADDRVEMALYSRAMGCRVKRVKVFKHVGDPVPIYATYEVDLPPDTNAVLQWLRVRRPQKWRAVEEDKGDPGVVATIERAFARIADHKPPRVPGFHPPDPPDDRPPTPVPAPVYVKSHLRSPPHG